MFGSRTATPECPRTDGPSHGFARTQTWKLDFGAYAADELHLSLSLEPTEISRSLGFDNFLVAYQVSFGKDLKLRLSVANDGKEPLHFEEALHTYLHVGDVEEMVVDATGEAALDCGADDGVGTVASGDVGRLDGLDASAGTPHERAHAAQYAVDFARQTLDDWQKKRSCRAARKAYETVAKLTKKVNLNTENGRAMRRGLAQLRAELEELEETF